MFILDEIVDVFDDLARFRYEHNLTIGYVVDGVCNRVCLFVEPLFLIVGVYGYVPLNKPREPKDYIDFFQVCDDKRASSINHAVGSVSYLEGQLVLVVRPQHITRKHAEHLCDGYTSPKI